MGNMNDQKIELYNGQPVVSTESVSTPENLLPSIPFEQEKKETVPSVQEKEGNLTNTSTEAEPEQNDDNEAVIKPLDFSVGFTQILGLNDIRITTVSDKRDGKKLPVAA